MPDTADFIQAAGAVLWRRNKATEIEIAVIHRPKYDDWSLPKGKLEAGESHIACAFREVLEETGVTAVFGPELGQTTYTVEGEKKIARYWSARATHVPLGKPDPLEVDKIQWLKPNEAKKELTNKDDCKVVDFFLDFGPDTTPLILLRHAKAVKRFDWDGDDGDRPLDVLGQRQAKRLLLSILPYAIQSIYSSDAMRCLDSVNQMAKILNLKLFSTKDLSEYGYAQDKESAIKYVRKLVKKNVSTLVCSHNPLLPGIVKELIGKKNFKNLDYEKLSPGDAWVLHHRDGEVVAIDWVLAPEV